MERVMKMKRSLLTIFVLLFSFSCAIVAMAGISIETSAWRKVEALGKKDSYTFLFFSDPKTKEGKNMQVTLEEIKQELTDKKEDVKVDIVEVMPDDSKEEKLIEVFRVQEKPTVLVIAPNGAVTGYFRKTVDKKALAESLVSMKEAQIIKTLQEGRVVFLCFNKNKEPNLATIKSDLKLVADNFRGAVNVIYASSDDPKEEKLKRTLEVSSEATAVFIIVPPGRAVARLEGTDITKANLMRALMSSCGSGCGSGCR